MVQILQGKFELYAHRKYPMTPVKPGKLIIKVENKVTVSNEEQNTYRSGVGKMLHMMRWLRPDIINVVNEC